MILVVDVETTGLPQWNKPSEDPCQPHIVQLAACLRSTDREVKDQKVINRLVKPDGWTIPSELVPIHGITTERAMDEGVPINDVLDEFLQLLHQASTITGFNIQFDKRLIRIQEKRRYGGSVPDEKLPIGNCWMRLKEVELAGKMTKHCNLTPTDKMMAAGRKTNKTPKLEEAFQHCYGRSIADGLGGKAHDALVDIKATMAIYWWLHEKGEIAA